MKISLYYSLFFLLINTISFSQADNKKILDSLNNVINTTKNELKKIDAIVSVAEVLSPINPDSAFSICLNALELSKKNNYKAGLSKSYGWLSYISNLKGQSLNSIEWLLKGIKILENDTSKSDLGSAYSNLGSIFYSLNNFNDALHYFHLSKSIRTEINDQEGLSNSLYNIGNAYLKIKAYDSALIYIQQSVIILEKIQFIPGLAYSKLAEASILYYLKKYDDALLAENEAMQQIKIIGDKRGEAFCLYGFGRIYFQTGKTQTSLNKALEAMNIAEIIKNAGMIRDISSLLRDIYSKNGDFKNAFLMSEKYNLMKDSINNKESQKAAIRSSFKVEYDMQHITDSINFVKAKEIESLKHDMEMKDERTKQLFLYVGVLLLLLVSLLIWKSYLRKKKDNLIIHSQKHEVEKQKHIIEEKQKEIIDSINYAKRIQCTLLAHTDFLNMHLSPSEGDSRGGYFVYFNPKDIVSGDFYWATKKDNKFYLAVCDSTGHGVPGAFMSLLNIGYLTEAINEKGIEKPNEVFNFVRQRLIDNISKEGQKDGFDGILICIESPLEKDGKVRCTYSAANNKPLLISNNIITELVADRMPVGKGEKQEDFKLHAAEVRKGDVLYLYTDGYADQFGGPNGKKFKYKALNELILANHNESVKDQKEILESTFESWRGNLEQVDDVCVIGIKI